MIKTVFIFQTQVSAIVVLNFILVAFKDVCIFCTSYIGVQSLYFFSYFLFYSHSHLTCLCLPFSFTSPVSLSLLVSPVSH